MLLEKPLCFSLDDKNLLNSQPSCVAALEAQVKLEFQASLQYILMAAHFDQVKIIRDKKSI